MGFRFRKSVKLGGVRINFSKKGVGASVGVKGARVSIGPRGVRKTLSIPGTGFSWVSEKRLGSSKKPVRRSTPQVVSSASAQPFYLMPLKIKYNLFVWLGVVLTLIGFGNPIFLLIGVPLLIYGIFKVRGVPQNQAASLFNKALKHYKQGKFVESNQLLEETLQIEPEFVPANILYAMHQFAEGNSEVAATKLKKIPSNLMDDYLNLLLAASCHEIGDNITAIPLLQSLLSKQPDDISLIEVLGSCFYHNENYITAIETLKKASFRSKSNPLILLNIRYLMAQSYIKLDKIREAKTQLAKICSEDAGFKDAAEILSSLG